MKDNFKKNDLVTLEITDLGSNVFLKSFPSMIA